MLFKFFFGRFKISAALLLLEAGCQTVPPLPPANLREPGWIVREGQAVWRQNRGAPEIAGEILVATRLDSQALVQFTKTPFPLIIAQRTTHAWQIEIPTQNKCHAGHGQPPARLIWFSLARILSGAGPPKGWSWQASKDNKDNQWSLANPSTGESLKGYFMIR